MPYLIDGHNLIPKIPGMTLTALDDEKQLIDLLQEFCRRTRKEAEVFFDNAPPGQARSQRFGMVMARFVRRGTTADQAIHQRLQRLGRAAANWTVVSSDSEVQSSARTAQARSVTSEAFVKTLLAAIDTRGKESADRENMGLKEDELDDWLDLFGVDE